MTTPTPVQPTTEQLVAGMAAGLLPLLGPGGLAASALVPALDQLYQTVMGGGIGKVFSVEDLEAIVADGDAAFAQLLADRAAQKAAGTP